jgi:hypothetical protein
MISGHGDPTGGLENPRLLSFLASLLSVESLAGMMRFRFRPHFTSLLAAMMFRFCRDRGASQGENRQDRQKNSREPGTLGTHREPPGVYL